MDLGEWKAEGDLIDWDADLPPLLPPSSEPSATFIPEPNPAWFPVPESSPEGGSCSWVMPSEGFYPQGQHREPRGSQMPNLPPTRSLLPPPPLSPASPSARPQPTISTVRALRVCHSPSSPWLEYPLPPASAHRPSSSTMAPSSLLSALARQSTASARLPRPSGSALVWRRPSCASELHSSGCSSSLLPSSSVRLLHPLGSTLVL